MDFVPYSPTGTSADPAATVAQNNKAVDLERLLVTAAPVERAVVAAVERPTPDTAQAAEAGWSTSEGQLSAVVVAVTTTLGGLVSSGAVVLPSGASPWVLAGLACAQAVVVGAYAIGRSVRKIGTGK